MLVLPFIMSYEVVMRYFFNKPTNWAVDFSEYILLFSTFLAAGWLLRKEEHIRLNLVVDILSKRTRSMINVFQSLLGTIACSLLLWSGLEATLDAIAKRTMIARALSFPKYIVLWIIPFGFLMLLIYFVKQGFNSFATLMVNSDVVNQNTHESSNEENVSGEA